MSATTDIKRILEPAAVIGLLSLVFAVGVYVGEHRYAVVIESITQRMAAHEAIDLHPGAVRTSVYNADQRAIVASLERLEAKLNLIEDRIIQR